MPQMAPLMWTPLMVSFSMLMMTMMIIMFFFSPVFKPSPSPKTSNSLMTLSNKPWVW